MSSAKRTELWEALRSVVDPELALDVVELGMVRQVDYDPDDDRAIVHLALTSLTCPVWDLFIEQVELALENLCTHVSVEFVVRPAWTPAWMSSEAHDILVAGGYVPPAGTFERMGRS